MICFFAHSAKREAAQNLISVTMLRQLLLPQLLLVVVLIKVCVFAENTKL